MLRLNSNRWLALLGLLVVFSWAPADAEAQRILRFFRGRQLAESVRPSECQSAPTPVTYVAMERDENKCKTCSFIYDNSKNAWVYTSYTCVPYCHCPLPTETGIVEFTNNVPCTPFVVPTENSFVIELEMLDGTMNAFRYMLPATNPNDTRKYIIDVKDARGRRQYGWSIEISRGSGEAEPCAVIPSDPPIEKSSLISTKDGRIPCVHTQNLRCGDFAFDGFTVRIKLEK